MITRGRVATRGQRHGEVDAMKLTYVIAALALVLGSACKKDAAKDKESAAQPAATEPKTAEPAAKPAAKGRSIPNANGLVVDAPAKWLDNGIGGAAGMHLDADAGMFTVRETAPEEAAKNLATFKKETEEVMFQKWISAEEIPDGFKTLYVLDKMTMKGEEMVKDGSTFAFTVRRKIGGKVYDCSGSAATQETAAEAIDLCLKVNAS